MKKENILSSFIFDLMYIALYLIISNEVNAKPCGLSEYRSISHKAFCETYNGGTTSCLGEPFPVKRAHVMCANKYHNDQNISMLTIDCQDNGAWTDEVFTCRPECDDTKISFNPIIDPKSEYPPWYVELVKFTTNKTIEKIYPGIILSERRVLIKKQYLKDVFNGNTLKKNFIVRIPRLKYDKPKEFLINYEEDLFNDQIFIFIGNYTKYDIINSTTVLYLHLKNYIKYDDVTLPACDEIYPEEAKGTLKLLHFGKRLTNIWWYENELPSYEHENRCIVPNIDKIGTELVCFQDFNIPIECRSRAYLVLKRCQIGYEQSYWPKSDYLDKCQYLNSWDHSHYQENTCNLVCGEIDESYRPRQIPLIYKGSELNHNGFAPWHVAVYKVDFNAKTIQQICGGSIIHSNTILTAAHCVYNTVTSKVNDASNYLIGAGKFHRQYDTPEESEHYANVTSIYIPEIYESFPIRNDIAILILDHHMKYTSNIKPICIDFSSSVIPADVEGHIFGWGAKSIDEESSNKLRVANLTTVTNRQCRIIVGHSYKSEITNDKFCAINKNGSSACGGDSGGGYVIKKIVDNRERYFLLGVISVGVNPAKYCSDGFTTVLTNVAIYKDFIQNITSNSRNENFFKNHMPRTSNTGSLSYNPYFGTVIF